MIELRFYELVGIVLILATAPLVAELLTLTVAALLPSKQRDEESRDGGTFPLAVVIPAHNEEALVGRCVRSLIGDSDQGIEVIVVAHNCTDSTAAEAEAAGARVIVLNDPLQTGKGYALKSGFAVALTGPALGVLVIDADSVASPGLRSEIAGRFLTGTKALQCRYQVRNTGDSQRTRMMTLAFQGFNVIRPRGRFRLGLSAGILGNGFALHREVIASIPYNAHSVVEDVEFHLSLVRAGIRVEFVDTATVYGEMPISTKGAEGQRARWEGGRLRLMMHWAPRLLMEVLRGRVRLLEPLADLLSAPITTELILLLVALGLPVTWLRLYAAAAFGVLLLHVGAAAVSGPGIWATTRVLASVPGYMVWKLSIFPRIWRTARPDATWVRTERELPEDGQ